MATNLWFWIGFLVFVLAMLALDLGVFHRTAHEISVREAAAWSATWIVLALLFAGGIYLYAGHVPATEFLTGYLIEKSLSIDNIFVIAMIFSYFAVPLRLQHRVLFWGILGALVMRGLFIALGAFLIATFHWIMYVFGALLLVTGIRMALREEKPFDGEHNPVIRLARKVVPLTPEYHGEHFFVRDGARRLATPLFLALLLVEVTDILFAVDSIPAIFAVTSDTFLVFTSNVFAILGLRSLYFLLARMVTRFHLLRYGLAAILVLVGAKMALTTVVEIPSLVSLIAIAVILTISVVASWYFPRTLPVVRDQP
ncbi:MAG TPA: TerC family protein [Gemmatimonadaceae bacterium]|jgi:tellurite resistance protein TerC